MLGLKLKTTPVCAYCGKLWPKHKGDAKDIPSVIAEQVKQHVESCPKNPLVQQNKQLQSENEKLKAELAPLKEFAAFVIASMAKTSNKWLCLDYSAENILKSTKQSLLGKGEQDA